MSLITYELIDCPSDRDFKFWRNDLVKRKRNASIFIFNQFSGVIPVRPNDVVLEIEKHVIHFIINGAHRITPYGKNTIVFSNPIHLVVKSIKVEPMQGLANGNDIEMIFRK